jgi:hypothetical protein
MLSRERAWRAVLFAILLGGLSLAPAGGLSPVRGAESAGDKPATVLRLTLGRLLAEHAYLTLEAMRSIALSGGDRDAIVTELQGNTVALTGAIRSVYGEAASQEFKRLWDQHIDGLAKYAEAAKAGDSSGAAAARRGLAAYRSAFSAFLAGANPHLSADGEAAALQLHLDQLVAFADGDYALGFETGRQAYSHMFDLGDDLAKAIAQQFPDRFPGAKVAFSPKAELRVTLGRLLGEHLVLSAEAMRAGISKTPDFASAQAALEANSGDLSTAIGGVYGTDAGRAFADLWTRHTRAYLNYIKAFAANDSSGKARALAVLRGYAAEFAAFISAANPKLPRSDVEALIRSHGESLITQVDAYAARDYRRSVTIVSEAHNHMFTVGDALANGIAAQFPDRFTDLETVPATDAAGASGSAEEARKAVALLLVVILIGAAMAISTRIRIARRPRDVSLARD